MALWDWFRKKDELKQETPQAPAEAAEAAPKEDEIKLPLSKAAREEIERGATRAGRSAELRASGRSTPFEEVKQRELQRLSDPANREAAALQEVINTFVPGSNVSVSPAQQAGRYVATNLAGKGEGFSLDASASEVFSALRDQIGRRTGDLADFIENNLAVDGSVFSIQRLKPLAASTIVGGEQNRTAYNDTQFEIDRQGLKEKSMNIAVGALKEVVSSLAAEGFGVRARPERKCAIDIRGNDENTRRQITQRLTDLGVPFNDALFYGRFDEQGESLPFDASKGDIRYIRILTPDNFAEQIDMLKDLKQLQKDIAKEQASSVERATVAGYIPGADPQITANENALKDLVRAASGRDIDFPERSRIFNQQEGTYSIPVPENAAGAVVRALREQGLMVNEEKSHMGAVINIRPAEVELGEGSIGKAEVRAISHGEFGEKIEAATQRVAQQPKLETKPEDRIKKIPESDSPQP